MYSIVPSVSLQICSNVLNGGRDEGVSFLTKLKFKFHNIEL